MAKKDAEQRFAFLQNLSRQKVYLKASGFT